MANGTRWYLYQLTANSVQSTSTSSATPPSLIHVPSEEEKENIVNTCLAKPKVPAQKKGGVHQPGLAQAVSGIQMHDYLWAKEENKKKDTEEKENIKGKGRKKEGKRKAKLEAQELVFVDCPKIKHIVQSLVQVPNIWCKTLLPNMVNIFNKKGDFAESLRDVLGNNICNEYTKWDGKILVSFFTIMDFVLAVWYMALSHKHWRTNMLDPSSRSNFQAARNKYRYALSAAKCSFFSDAIIEAEGDQKKLYSIIKSLTTVKSDMPLPHHTSLQQLAEDFGQFFIKKIEDIRTELNIPVNLPIPQSPSYTGTHLTKFNQLTHADVKKLVMSSKTTSCDLDPIPTRLLKDHITLLSPIITKIINLSLQTGEFPNEWKLAFVKPLLKKPGLATTLKNYRPISNLSFISKITERAIISQQKEHMEQNCLLPVMSSAYRQGHSTESALLKVQADILHNMEQQRVTLLVLIDLSAAFDTVDHPILFQCLEERFGVKNSVLSWYKSYLSDRKQCIILNGMQSNIFHLPLGVPQGSCLGLVLFTQYASSLFDIFNKHSICAHAYADDHQLYTSFSANQISLKEAVNRMESCLQDVKSWMILNKLKMNDSKTECILIGSYQQLAKINLTSILVGEHRITVLDDIRNLGAYFDKNLSMKTHIDTKCTAAFRQLYSLRKIRKYLSHQATESLIHAFIFSHIDYCNGLLNGAPKYQIKKLQRIQNMAARLVYKLPKSSHITPLLINLHWLPVEYRIRYKILLYTFKAIHQSAPQYINDMFTIKSTRYRSRLSSITRNIEFVNGDISREIVFDDIIYLEVPRTKSVTFKQRSLEVSGPQLWNSLPTFIKMENSLAGFKNKIKTYLFKLAFNI